ILSGVGPERSNAQGHAGCRTLCASWVKRRPPACASLHARGGQEVWIILPHRLLVSGSAKSFIALVSVSRSSASSQLSSLRASSGLRRSIGAVGFLDSTLTQPGVRLLALAFGGRCKMR